MVSSDLRRCSFERVDVGREPVVEVESTWENEGRPRMALESPAKKPARGSSSSDEAGEAGRLRREALRDMDLVPLDVTLPPSSVSSPSVPIVVASLPRRLLLILFLLPFPLLLRRLLRLLPPILFPSSASSLSSLDRLKSLDMRSSSPRDRARILNPDRLVGTDLAAGPEKVEPSGSS